MTQLMTDEGRMVRVPAGTWKVDRAHSSVAFEVKHMLTIKDVTREVEITATVEGAGLADVSAVRA
jgi:polyisoprenoid-binding protein YceI